MHITPRPKPWPPICRSCFSKDWTLPVNTVGPGLDKTTSHESDADREYSTEVVFSQGALKPQGQVCTDYFRANSSYLLALVSAYLQQQSCRYSEITSVLWLSSIVGLGCVRWEAAGNLLAITLATSEASVSIQSMQGSGKTYKDIFFI